MSYISKKIDELQLPDGTVASSIREIDSYLRRNGLTMASDYSPDTIRRNREAHNNRLRTEMFATFIQHYKRKIWNEKK